MPPPRRARFVDATPTIPAWARGVIQYINQYEGGPAGFVARADQLPARYGDRFEVPESLRAKATAREAYACHGRWNCHCWISLVAA